MLCLLCLTQTHVYPSRKLLSSKQDEIQNIQRLLGKELELQENPDQKQEELATVRAKLNILRKDPILTGMSPLYKDYEPERWWFEAPKFISTLVLCGVATLVPAESASQVFIALATSTTMIILFANCQPYISTNDDILAQFCQISLTFTVSVGLLNMASEAFQVIASSQKLLL